MAPRNLSVNQLAWKLIEELRSRAEEYGVLVEESRLGATIIDAGIEARGGYLAGKVIAEICLGGLGRVEITCREYGHLTLPAAFVQTDHPAIATLGSQFAGWKVRVGGFFALGSGPARALALKPRRIYEEIAYQDRFDRAVLVLETSKKPPEDVISQVAQLCQVSPSNLALILVPTSSVAGSTQVAGRIVETGVHKLARLGLDPKKILCGWGISPIPPVHLDPTISMGRMNDAILYAGVVGLTVDVEDDQALRRLVERAPSSSSKTYGKPFIEILREAGYDFYRIDPDLFAPAVVIVNNVSTGTVLRAGRVNVEMLERSVGLL